jgi:hypothetical protein
MRQSRTENGDGHAATVNDSAQSVMIAIQFEIYARSCTIVKEFSEVMYEGAHVR